MHTSDCPTRDQLVDYVRCVLAEVDVDLISDHLDECANCERIVVTLECKGGTAVSRLPGDSVRDTYEQEPDYRRMMSQLRNARGSAICDEVSANGTQPTGSNRMLGDYELMEVIGRGGMGLVYKAKQHRLNRIVAVKTIRGGELATPSEVDRFQIEAQAAAGLQHTNIVAIHEVGEHEGQHFYSMELVEGPSLGDLLRDAAIPIRTVAAYMLQLAEGVDYAHQHGVLHRDLKPSNVIVSPEGQLKITDFGLAKSMNSQSGLTHSGQFLGTPSYTSPEQALAKLGVVGHASDIYSLGAVLYALLTGRPPFRGESSLETLQQVRENDPVAIRVLNPKVPRDLRTICSKCLQKDPGQRYSSAAALANDVRRFLAGEPILARPPNVFSHVWNFFRHPNRIRDAGALTVFLGTVLFAWHLFGLLMFGLERLFGIPFPLEVTRDGEFVATMIGFNLVFLVMILIGYKILAQRHVALWIGTFLNVSLGVFSVSVLFEVTPFDLGGVLIPELKTALFLLWTVLSALMLAVYVAALAAYHCNKALLVSQPRSSGDPAERSDRSTVR